MTTLTTHTVAIIDDHTLVRDGLAATLAREPDLKVVHVGGDPRAVLALEPRPDLVMLDLDLDGTPASAQDAAAMLARGSHVLIVSALGSPEQIRAMIRAGVDGFVAKRDSASTLSLAIRTVLGGQPWTTPDLAAILANDPSADRPDLTDQEQRVLMLYASGLKMAAVARTLHISPYTAKEYIDRVRAKYANAGRPASTKLDLHREAVRDGYVEP